MKSPLPPLLAGGTGIALLTTAAFVGGMLPLSTHVDAPALRAELAHHLSVSECGDALVTAAGEDISIRGDGSRSFVIRSPRCVASVRVALQRMGARNIYIAEGLSGLNVPGKDRLVGNPAITFEGPTLNLFTFSDDGSLIWQRYVE